MRGQRADCAVCNGSFATKVDGALRRHPRGAEVPCPGSDELPGWTGATPSSAPRDETTVTTEPVASAAPVVLRPGVYRADEPMMTDIVIPPGHVAVQITAVYLWPAEPVRTPKDEATLLFEVPTYLYKVLDGIPNDKVKVTLKVPSPWLPTAEMSGP